MKFLCDRRRAGVLALFTALLGAAALMLGVGGAGADTCGTTNGSLGDATVYVAGVVAADLDANTVGASDPGFWLCVAPPGQGLGVGVHDASKGAAGYQVDFLACGSLTPGCMGFEDTGAEVEPATSTSLVGPTPSASAGSGAGTCVYANGSPTCPGPTPLVGTSVATGDLPQPTATGGTTVCVGVQVGATCVGTVVTVPTTATVTVGGDTGNDTAEVEVAGTSHPVNIGRECVGTPMPC